MDETITFEESFKLPNCDTWRGGWGDSELIQYLLLAELTEEKISNTFRIVRQVDRSRLEVWVLRVF